MIQDKCVSDKTKYTSKDWHQEALSVLLQLQYKKNEALKMIDKALLDNSKNITTTEELLNEIYKQRIKE